MLYALTGFLDDIVSYIYAKEISLPPKVDLFLGLGWRDGIAFCAYYFADHVHRSIFWLDDVDVRTLSISGVITPEPSHLAHAIEARYWSVLTVYESSFYHIGLIAVARSHCYSFPVCQEMTSDIIEEVNDFLVNCLAGRLSRKDK